MVPVAGPGAVGTLTSEVAEDPWLTEVAGFAVLRLAATPTAVRALRDRADARAMGYTSVAAADPPALEPLTAAGMAVIDVNVTLAAAAPAVPSDAPSPVVRADPALADPIAELAARAMRQSRFHRDPRFPDSAAEAIKREWARNCVLGRRGLEVLTVLVDGRPAGFLAVTEQGNDRVIDLVAVDAPFRGRGVGRALVDAFAHRHAGGGRLLVGTQVGNAASLGLYCAAGFRPIDARYVLHAHVWEEA